MAWGTDDNWKYNENNDSTRGNDADAGNDDNMWTCAGCGAKTKIWMAIDNWAVEDGSKNLYCRNCQKRMGIGWYEKK